MHKLKLLFILFFMCINTYSVYADDNIIKIGLTKYSQSLSVNINNNDLSFSTIDNYNFNTDFSLSSKDGVILKPIIGYTIKTYDRFASYDDAQSSINNYNDTFIIKEDDYYYKAINMFEYKDDALSFKNTNNIDGDILNINSYIGIHISDNLKVAIKDTVFIKDMNTNIVSINGNGYRNIIRITNLNDNLNVVNILDVEQYLYGVVPAEMPPSWELEALKAQAVSARNYARLNMNVHKGSGYNLCDTTHCQVYGGVKYEKDSTTKAVNETRGIYAYYDDNPINATYFSSSGGYTANSENVWNEKVPYLKSIKDDLEKGAMKWKRSITFDEISNALNIGDIKEIVLEHSSFNNRVLSMKFIAENNEKVLLKENIRTFFSKFKDGSLPSRNFSIVNSIDIENDSNSNEIFAISKNKKYMLDLDNLDIINSENINKDNLYAIDKNNSIISLPTHYNNEPTNNNIMLSSLKKEDNEIITFVGKGFGHGVGMSQYGANSLAKNGYTYDEILKYYYTDISVK